MTVQAACTALATLVRTISAIRAAPDKPRAQANVFPFAAVYAAMGEIVSLAVGDTKLLTTLHVDVHVSLAESPDRALPTLAGIVDSMATLLLANPTLTATVSTVNGIRWRLANAQWGGVPTVAIRFEIDVKQLHA